MSAHAPNVDKSEIAKFEQSAARWWDPSGAFKPLHDINPLRLEYIERAAGLAGKRVLDVGCGGGLLAEAMAGTGAQVTGIDASESTLAVARMHAQSGGVPVTYLCTTAEDMLASEPAPYDVVTCLELLEHVPDPQCVVQACAALAKPGGDVFFSTVNRTGKAYVMAVAGAEYLLRLLPRGTHDYARFIRPAELAVWLRLAGLELVDLQGMRYNPFSRGARLCRDVSVNYLVHARRLDD